MTFLEVVRLILCCVISSGLSGSNIWKRRTGYSEGGGKGSLAHHLGQFFTKLTDPSSD